jgi:ABC-type polysaccharide transport system permease subunit
MWSFFFLFQIPSKPNYSLVLYYAADRPINKSSLLGKFVDGTDLFRDSRFKLIPSIVEVFHPVKIITNIGGFFPVLPLICGGSSLLFEINRDIGWSSAQLEQKLAYWGKQ